MRLLLFDIDHTLIDSRGAGRAAMEIAATRQYGPAEWMQSIPVDGRTDRAIFEEILGRHGVRADEMEPALAAFVDIYLNALPRTLEERRGHVLTGVAELIIALEHEDAMLGLGTGNVRAGARIKLEYFGLWHRFADGGFGDCETDRQHVIVAGIRALTARAGTEAGGAVVLGDTPFDIRAAHDAGARAVGVATGGYDIDALTAAGADAALPDLADTRRALEALLG